MSDEIEEAPVEDTPQIEEQTDTTDWQKRYQDLQPEYTRTSQALKRFESDPDALIEFIQQHHPDLLADDEEPDVDVDEDDDPQYMTKAEFAEFQQAQAAEKATAQYEADLKKFVGDRELSAFGRKAIDYSATRGEINTPEDLQKAVDEWFEYDSQRSAPEPKKRKAPHVLAGGQENTGTKDWGEMTRSEIDQEMAERALARASQT